MIPQDPAALLKWTREMRVKAVNNIVPEGQFPDDPKMLRVMAGFLDGIDKQVQTTQRMEQDNQNAQADREIAAQSARIVDQIRREAKGNPFAAGSDYVPAGVRSKAEADESQLPEIEVVPGQMDITPAAMTHDEFMDQMEAQREG
jgi:hypothetical protein